MREIVEAKAKLAEEQLAAWQRKLAEAQEQVIRWHAVMGTCQELLAEDVVEDAA